MKTATLCGIALLCSSTSFAQTPASTMPAASPTTITMTGCVGGGAAAQPITLSNAMIVPPGSNPTAGSGAATSPVPGAVSQPTTQPPGAVGAAGTTGSGVGTAGTASAGVGTATTGTSGVGTAGTAGAGVGTAGTASAGVGTAGTAGAAGSAGTSGAPRAGVTGTVAGTAPAGSSASSASGYRLSGTDMSGWVGRRVQISGMMAPSTAGASATNPAANASATLPEFRVISVQPISGNCPPQP